VCRIGSFLLSLSCRVRFRLWSVNQVMRTPMLWLVPHPREWTITMSQSEPVHSCTGLPTHVLIDTPGSTSDRLVGCDQIGANSMGDRGERGGRYRGRISSDPQQRSLTGE
jgi:hypothetical protein